MNMTWVGAIIVGTGCLAVGYYFGTYHPATIFFSARLAKGNALNNERKKKNKPKEPLEIEQLADILDHFKMVLVVRNELKMGKGKIASQCSHATLGLYRKLLQQAPKALNRWEMSGQPKVVVKIETEEDMLVLQEKAKSLKLPTHITIDAGRTQIAPNSRTVMAILEPSMQLRRGHKLYEVVERINDEAESYIGLVMAYPTEEQVLESSGFFVPTSANSTVQLAGRTFNIGKIKGVDVIYVMTGEQMVNAAMTVQILLDTFNVQGIVHYGTAGSANDSLSFGDVSVPISFAFTSSWYWKEFMSETGNITELKFGAYNLPQKGENLLASIEFEPTQFYSTGKPMEEAFWLQVDAGWFNLSTKLQDVKLEQCINQTYCLPETPKVVHGLRGSTADIFLDNAAYREFLFNEFNVSTVDEESAAIVMTSLSNEVPCVVFRGVSDLAGGETLSSTSAISLSSLAAINALTVAVDFIGLFSKEAQN